MLSCRQSFIVTQVCWQGICDLTLLAEVKTPAELCIVGKKNAASLKPNQTQLLAAGNSPSSPTPLGADPVKIPIPCCLSCPLVAVCAVAGAAAPWGSTIVTLLGTSWLGAGLRLSPSALPAGALWGSGPFPGASYQPSADCWAGRMLHRDFSSWYVGFDFIFQHRF